MWNQHKIAYEGTSATRLRALTLKFQQYVMDSKHSMAEHLRTMSALIRHLKAAGNNLFDEQQVTAVIRSLPEPTWGQIKLVLTHKIISLLHTHAPSTADAHNISNPRTHQQPTHTSTPHTSFCVLMLIISYLIIQVFKVVVESLLLDMNFQVLVMLWGYIYFYVFQY